MAFSRSPDQNSLSDRETQIARAYAAGQTYREIAEQLFIAPATVRTHLGTIYRKLGVSSKIELLRTLEGAPLEPVDGAPERRKPARRLQRSETGKRQVTVLYAIADRVPHPDGLPGPEDIAADSDAMRLAGAEAATCHRGQLLGDQTGAVVVCFGLLTSDETDAERAVECALSIRDRLTRRSRPDGSRLDARIGIYTGSVVVHSGAGGEQFVDGSATYLAAALAREANDSGVVVCAHTKAMLGGLFAFEDLGASTLDHVQNALPSFGVTGAKRSGTRFEALHGCRRSRLVGRDREIALLESLFERAGEGDGQAALIAGEPGIGKSRLIRALTERLGVPQDAMLVFQCSPHQQSSPLHPVVRWLRYAAGAGRDATEGEQLDALVALFGDAIEDTDESRQLVAELTSIRRVSPEGVEVLSPERRRAATLTLLDRFLCRRSPAGSSLVIFEDMQWADPTTAQWFEHVLELVETLPVLVLATARPEFTFRPVGRQNVTVLNLARLRRDEVLQIVVDQTDEQEVTPDLAARIAERAEGIPLFAEELTRAVVELGELEVSVPVTLQASLTGRLDRLGPSREVAQAAAVIGREFDHELLAEIVPHGPRSLEKALGKLLESRLVLRRPAGGPGALQFKHALVRDAAYDSLLRPRRQGLHLALAETLLARRASGHEVAPEVVAGHLIAACEPGRAAPLLIEAVRAAVWNRADSEAEQLARQGIKATEAIEDDDARDAAAYELLMLLYGPIYRRGDVGELLDIVTRAETAAERLGDRARLSKALDSKSYVLASAGRVGDAIATGKRCVRISAELDNYDVYVGANMMLGRAFYAAGRYREAAQQLQELREYLGDDIQGSYIGSGHLNQVVCALVWLTFVNAELGEWDAAKGHIDEAFQIIPTLRVSEHELVWASTGFGRLRQMRGDNIAVIEKLDPMLDLCRHKFPVYLPRLAMSLGPALVGAGEGERGIALLAEADAFSEKNRFRFLWALLLAQYSRALLEFGELVQSEAIARRALAVASDAGEVGSQAWARLAAGEAFITLGRSKEARPFLDSAATIASEREMAPLLRLCDSALARAE